MGSCTGSKGIFLMKLCLFWGALTLFSVSNARGNGGSHRFGWQREKVDVNLRQANVYSHPLDPLTEMEVNTTSSIIRNGLNNPKSGAWAFIYISLKEPEKSALLPYFLRNMDPSSFHIPRKSFTVLLDRSRNQAYEVVVNLDTRRIESWVAAPPEASTNIGLTPEESLEAEKIFRNDKAVIERCRRLGWTNMSLVTGSSWLTYIFDRDDFQGRRLVQIYLYGKNFEDDNQNAHPFDFLPVVDLNEKRVIAIEELPVHDDIHVINTDENIVPRAESNWLPHLRDPGSYRDDIRPVRVSQPEGTSFRVTGNQVEWQKFKMRIGFSAREGVTIHHVNYNDGGNARPLFYKLSLAEVITSYGDPRHPFYRKVGYDEGKYGLGYRLNELQPQIDCIGQVEFLDFVVHNGNGEAKRIKRAVCIYEEDAGVLWKHTDFRNGKSATVRSRRLGITFTATVGNYDYIFIWNFYQDGSIEFLAKLTGILIVNLLAVNATPAGHGSIVFPQINAQYHQHFFSLRLDAEIDGNENSVVVQDVVPVQEPTGSPENPYGQGITTRNTLLKTAGEGRTNVSVENSRTWHIRNPNHLNPYTKEPVAWKLIPWPTPSLNIRRDSPLHPESAWLVPYQENQMFSGGFYVNNSGLPEWVGQNKNANINNTDIVLFHNFGISHIPRVEDFPTMPSESCGVMLKPLNFFNENPALDVPPATADPREEL